VTVRPTTKEIVAICGGDEKLELKVLALVRRERDHERELIVSNLMDLSSVENAKKVVAHVGFSVDDVGYCMLVEGAIELVSNYIRTGTPKDLSTTSRSV
jgi:hypothetical protein